MSWWHDAACKGMDSAIFFPDAGGYHVAEPAKEICRRCPVQVECLRDAMATEGDRRFGIRGGLTPDERRELRRRERV